MSKYVFQTSRPGHNDPQCSPSESACSCSHFCHALLPEPQWLKNLMQCWRSSAVQSEAWLPVLLQTAQSTICCHGSAVWRWLKHCWRYPAIVRNQLTSTTYLSNDPKRSSVGATQVQTYNTQTDQTANIETNEKFEQLTPATQIDEFVPEPAPLTAAEMAS